jgi:cytosine/adenosine deaminase-related metal-dependent hydrolase
MRLGLSAICMSLAALLVAPAAFAAKREVLISGATVVTMNAKHRVIPRGNVLIGGGKVRAIWRGADRPRKVTLRRLRRAIRVRATGRYLFPGLINLHDHLHFGYLHAWPAPSSHAIPAQGKAGVDPYDNRYEWNTAGMTTPDELRRLVVNPESALDQSDALGLAGEVVKHAEVQGLLGGETSTQGGVSNPETDGILARNVERDVFNTRIAPPRVGPISSMGAATLADLVNAMKSGAYDAWLVHLAEGVRDAQRRPGDTVSSRAEFQDLISKQLLNDITVIVHGTGLERSDFRAMAAAGSIRMDGRGDGRGAKLVWSPRSNLQLYGRTASVYEALAEGVLVSLGTDWTPSGSANLLGELKVAERALRDSRVLGGSRSLVGPLSLAGRTPRQRRRAEIRLDRTLVDMVTRNPALTLRWGKYVGSIAPGLRADLILVRRPLRKPGPPDGGLPASPYRALIEATEADVQLVMVNGEALVAGEPLMRRLSPGDFEIVQSAPSGYRRAIDATLPGVPEGNETFAQLRAELSAALTALGGDSPPVGGGPAPDTNTYNYLKARWAGGAFAAATDLAFRTELTSVFGIESGMGRLNIEGLALKPLIDEDDDFLRHLLNGDIGGGGLIADPTPPFMLYQVNLNHIGPAGNPLAGLP